MRSTDAPARGFVLYFAQSVDTGFESNRHKSGFASRGELDNQQVSEDPYLHRQPRCPSGSAATSAPAAAQKTGQESVQKSGWRTVPDVRFIRSLPDIMLDQPDTRIPRKRSQSMKVSHWVFYVIFLANPQFSQFSGTYFEQLLQQEVSFRISPRVWTLGSNRTDITLDSLQEESWTTNRCPEIRIFTANLAALPEVQQLQRRQLLKKPDKNPFKNPNGTKKVTINEGKSLGFLCHFFGQSTIFPIFRYLF